MSGQAVTRLLAGLALLCLFAIVALWSAGVQAQEGGCAPHDQVVKVLANKYKEGRRAMGLIDEKTMMEAYVSDKGTWTFLVTNADGLTCVLAAGEDFEMDTTAFDKAKKGEAM